MSNSANEATQRPDLLPTKTYFIIGFDKFLTEEEHEAVMSYLDDPFILEGTTSWIEDVFYNNPKTTKHANDIESEGEILEA